MSPPSDSELPAVVVDGVSKTFKKPHEAVHTLKERALHPFRRTGHDQFEALKDVSFAVPKGEFFGIVGRNGSGKSTLLKCMAGIYGVDTGAIYVNGRVSTFIELGVGFNPDLAARDNVALNAVMLGLSPKDARERFERVIDFAELHEFVDLKLKNYSSGMQVRLAFSVMIEVDADILLIDEVLAVGDAAFQQKCFDVFHRMRDEGRTILFVTHDMGAVKRFCDRALLIERGVTRMIGQPDEVASNYLELNFGREGGRDEESGEERYGDQTVQIVEAWFEDDSGERQTALPQGEPCRFRMRVAFQREIENPALAVLLENEAHLPLFATSTDAADWKTGTYGPGDEVVFSVQFENVFAPGRVYASPWVTSGVPSNHLLDRRPQFANVMSTGASATGGIVNFDHDVMIETPSGEKLTARAT